MPLGGTVGFPHGRVECPQMKIERAGLRIDVVRRIGDVSGQVHLQDTVSPMTGCVSTRAAATCARVESLYASSCLPHSIAGAPELSTRPRRRSRGREAGHGDRAQG